MSITIIVDPFAFPGGSSYYTFESNATALTSTTTAQNVLFALYSIEPTFPTIVAQATFTPIGGSTLQLQNKQYVIIRTPFTTLNTLWGTSMGLQGWIYNSSDATHFPDIHHNNLWPNLIAYNASWGYIHILFAFQPGFTYSLTISAENQFLNMYNISETACFLQGTLVQTPKGKKPIESISKHSFVSNQHGQPVRVLHTTQQTLNYFKHPDLMYKIPKHARGNTEDVFVTKTHPILVNGQRKEARDFGYPLATMEEIADANGDFTVYNLSIEDGNTKHRILVNGHCEMGVGE